MRKVSWLAEIMCYCSVYFVVSKVLEFGLAVIFYGRGEAHGDVISFSLCSFQAAIVLPKQIVPVLCVCFYKSNTLHLILLNFILIVSEPLQFLNIYFSSSPFF